MSGAKVAIWWWLGCTARTPNGLDGFVSSFLKPNLLVKFDFRFCQIQFQLDLTDECSINEDGQCGDEVTCIHRCETQNVPVVNFTVQYCRSLA